MSNLVSGIKKFQREVYPAKRDLFEKLALGQQPSTLLITCSDSRVMPELLTQTEPGEMFVIRNAGNIVPAYGGGTGGVTATVEYAVAVLRVNQVIICGHSDCGAMKAALQPDVVSSLPAVAAWLRHADAAREVIRQTAADLDGAALLNVMIRQNVLAQIANLKTHPPVAGRLAKGDLAIQGWVYDIAAGNIEAYDPQQRAFVPLTEAALSQAALLPD